MRILHIYTGNLYGGVERMLASMARSGQFADSSYSLCFDGRLSAELVGLGAHVVRMPQARIRNPLSVRRLRSEMEDVLRSSRYEAVICHGVWIYCVAAPAVRKAGHQPVLFLHDLPEPQKAMYRWAWLQPPRLCVANSEFVARAVARLGGRTRTRVVHPLVLPGGPHPAAEVDALRRSLGAGASDVVITQASRLDGWKGHRTLLRALGALRDVPAWQAWIAGSPQREEERAYLIELKGLADRLGIAQRVRFIGHRTDMSLVLAASDVYCQPNEQPEPFGMVFVEALAASTPVVATNDGGVREIVDADCGLLCDPDPESVSRALRRLIEDRSLRDALGPTGRARAAALCGAESFRTALDAALR